MRVHFMAFAAVVCLLAGGDLFLQSLDVAGHPVDGVGTLLDKIFHNAHPLVIRLLETGDGVLKLLNLCLKLHHLLRDGERRRGWEDKGRGEERGGEM